MTPNGSPEREGPTVLRYARFHPWFAAYLRVGACALALVALLLVPRARPLGAIVLLASALLTPLAAFAVTVTAHVELDRRARVVRWRRTRFPWSTVQQTFPVDELVAARVIDRPGPRGMLYEAVLVPREGMEVPLLGGGTETHEPHRAIAERINAFLAEVRDDARRR